MAQSELVKFDQLQADITLFVEPCKSIAVANDDEMKFALEAAKQVKSFIKKVEEVRVNETKPLVDRQREINTYAKKIVAPLEEAETHIKKQLVGYERLKEEKRQLELRKAEEARKAAEAEAAPAVELVRPAASVA